MKPWVMAAVAVLAAGSPAWAESVKVKVESGVLAGEATDRAAVFRNIPYAAPPVGPLRWKPPAPPAAWSGERPAVRLVPPARSR